MSAFSVDLDTGLLSFDDTIPPYFVQPELINTRLDLLVDGYGVYSLVNGNVLIEGSGFAQPSRILSASGTMTLTDGTIITLDSEDIVSYQTNFDAGQVPIGTTAAATFRLTLANDDRRWDYGGEELGTKSLDGAIIDLQMSAYRAIENDDFIVTPDIIDGELTLTGDGEENLFSIVDGELVYTGDNAYMIADGILTVTDDLYVWGWQDMPSGVFVVDKINNQQHIPALTLSGSDYMGNRMMTAYVDNNTYPATYQTIIEDACTQAGVTLSPLTDHVTVAESEQAWVIAVGMWNLIDWADGTLSLVWENTTTHALKRRTIIEGDPVEYGWQDITEDELITEGKTVNLDALSVSVKPVLPTGKITTCRDIVGWICAMAGANATINRQGALRVRGIDDTGERIDPARYVKLTTNNNFASMNYEIRLYEYAAPMDTPPLTKTYALNGDVPYYIVDIRDNPYLYYGNANNQSILDNKINLVALWVMARHSALMEWTGSETISPLDTMTVELLNGAEIKVGVTQHLVRFDTGLGMESGCDLPTVTLSNAMTAYK